MFEDKKNERANELKEVMHLYKDFEFNYLYAKVFTC